MIGHVNPDTDSIASAMGYAWLLRERDGLNTVPARAGALNPQTAWVLKTLSLDPPVLLTDASPRFESVMKRLDTLPPSPTPPIPASPTPTSASSGTSGGFPLWLAGTLLLTALLAAAGYARRHRQRGRNQ